jgi:hypothetical protein
MKESSQIERIDFEDNWKNYVLFGKELSKRIKWFFERIPSQQENQGWPWFSQELNHVTWPWPWQVTAFEIQHKVWHYVIHTKLSQHRAVFKLAQVIIHNIFE